ncbi:MAG: SRPBCC domain-containing protein [Phototrophicaceae bacterium]
MSNEQSSTKSVVIERTFDAPIALVWQLWTEPEHFKNWYGPQGFTIPVAEMDVSNGGKRLICMSSPDGSMTMWTVGEFTEIIPNERLVYTESMSDENGNVIAPPSSEHPSTTTVIVELEDLNGQTKMTMTHEGVPADSPGASGWEQAFVKLEAHLNTSL